MTWHILAPWLFTLVTAATGILVSLSQKCKLVMPRVYLAYFVVAGSIQLSCLLIRPGHYPIIFWISELTHNIVLCLLSLEIISDLLPSRFVKFWAIAFLVIMVVGLVNSIPTTAPITLLNLSVSASLTCAFLLVLLVFFRVSWTKEYVWVTAGVVAVLAGDFISSRQMTAHIGTKLILAIQLAPTPGLILLSLAGSSKVKNQREVDGHAVS